MANSLNLKTLFLAIEGFFLARVLSLQLTSVPFSSETNPITVLSLILRGQALVVVF